ncbi:thiamine-phosphate kinase [Aerosakkonemataceae cyanobacterium BLCC-F154]|uniref:Thiamine-monophosphate kinase n=1 Tax=Floridaenema fluviatile BLCC-F154 TaxID=3153640 RepID=A0ABV4YHX1_9CYAN
MSESNLEQKVKEIGEQGLLQKLHRFCPPDMIGDDAAVMQTLPEQSLIVTTDVLVEGVHFSDRTTSPEDAGWRAAAANLSDLAAMGATPLGITVGLAINGDTAVSWVEKLYQGMNDCLQVYHTPIVGGDVVRSPINTISITAFGQANPNCIIRRTNARPGYAIVVTGIHGAAKAGLELLLNPELGKNLSDSEKNTLIKAHQRPKPRLDILPTLQEILSSSCLLSSSIPLAGMDSSDGLADAIIQICKFSQVGAKIERSQIPIPPAFPNWLSPEQSIEWVLYGGEDFELVLCLPLEIAESLVEKLNKESAIIGRITQEKTVKLIDSTGNHADEILHLSQGFQHFK